MREAGRIVWLWDSGQKVRIDIRGNRRNGRFLIRENKIVSLVSSINPDWSYLSKELAEIIDNSRKIIPTQHYDNRIIANEAETAILCESMCIYVLCYVYFVCVFVCVCARACVCSVYLCIIKDTKGLSECAENRWESRMSQIFSCISSANCILYVYSDIRCILLTIITICPSSAYMKIRCNNKSPHLFRSSHTSLRSRNVTQYTYLYIAYILRIFVFITVCMCLYMCVCVCYMYMRANTDTQNYPDQFLWSCVYWYILYNVCLYARPYRHNTTLSFFRSLSRAYGN